MNVQSTTMPVQLSITTLVERAARTHGARTLVEHLPGGARVSMRLDALAERALAFGRGLRALGLPERSVIACLLGNRRELLEAMWGVPAAGLVLHPLNPRAPREALLHALRRAQDACLFVDAEHAALGRELQAEAGVPFLVVVGEANPGAHAYAAVCEAGAAAPAVRVDDEHHPAMMSEAAGTVGLPRAVVYSHRALVLHAMACATVDGLGLGRRDVVLPAMPLHHANGCGLPFTLALLGHDMVLLDPAAPPERLRAVLAAEGVTFAAGVTSAWVALREELDLHPDGPHLSPRLRLLAGGSAALPALLADLGRHGVEVLHVYGMTETGPLASSALGESAQGAPVPLMELRVVGDGGDERPWDDTSEGEILLRGPWVAGSYVALGATPDRWSTNGWLRTGDLGVRDARGVLRMTGRRKPLARCGGEWIDTDRLSHIVREHPAVAAVTARVVADPRLIEKPELTVISRDGMTVDGEALRAWIAARWAGGAAPPVEVILAVTTPFLRRP